MRFQSRTADEDVVERGETAPRIYRGGGRMAQQLVTTETLPPDVDLQG
jgi:hypothetical protein